MATNLNQPAQPNGIVFIYLLKNGMAAGVRKESGNNNGEIQIIETIPWNGEIFKADFNAEGELEEEKINDQKFDILQILGNKLCQISSNTNSSSAALHLSGGVQQIPPNSAIRHQPEELLAILVQKIRREAEKCLGKKLLPASLVVILPLGVNNNFRLAIQSACSMAGFYPVQFISETSAAVLYVCQQEKQQLNLAAMKQFCVLTQNLNGTMEGALHKVYNDRIILEYFIMPRNPFPFGSELIYIENGKPKDKNAKEEDEGIGHQINHFFADPFENVQFHPINVSATCRPEAIIQGASFLKMSGLSVQEKFYYNHFYCTFDAGQRQQIKLPTNAFWVNKKMPMEENATTMAIPGNSILEVEEMKMAQKFGRNNSTKKFNIGKYDLGGVSELKAFVDHNGIFRLINSSNNALLEPIDAHGLMDQKKVSSLATKCIVEENGALTQRQQRETNNELPIELPILLLSSVILAISLYYLTFMRINISN